MATIGLDMSEEGNQNIPSKGINNKNNEKGLVKLDEELNSLGILSNGLIQPKSRNENCKNLVSRIRGARDFENNFLHKKNTEYSFNSIQNQLEIITTGNRRIEDEIKFEIMGIDKKPLKKIGYRIMQLYNHQFKNLPRERAEEIIEKQVMRVGKVITDLGLASESISGRVENLERYYDRVLFNLISKYNNRTQSLNKIDKITSLMDKTEGMTKKSSEFEERLVYGNAHRKLRTQLQKELQSLKLDDRAMLLLKNELPLLDNLNSICLSYSGALEETRQEATYLATHLMQVKESYFDMMRSHRVNKNLEGEASKLLSYADNMNNSLRKCSNEIVQKANDNSLFSAHYEQRTLTLDSVLNDIEDSNSGAFNQLENKISAYLQP